MAEVSEWAAGMKRERPRRMVLFGSLAVAAAIVYLVVSGVRGAAIYSLTIAELAVRKGEMLGQGVRVQGALDASSVRYDARNLRLAFDLNDGGHTLHVEHAGAPPDMFRDGAQVIVEGRLRTDGTFEAQTVLLTCPSRYEAEAEGR
ncbi:MAG: cytochrome c maturation protein CcmE [Anaerolineae bacterium]|nr:cytochrome c maturation protein CcmE [Anaerolineae bacterium]